MVMRLAKVVRLVARDSPKGSLVNLSDSGWRTPRSCCGTRKIYPLARLEGLEPPTHRSEVCCSGVVLHYGEQAFASNVMNSMFLPDSTLSVSRLQA